MRRHRIRKGIRSPTLELFRAAGGIDQLNPEITANSITVSPSFRYKAIDANAVDWDPWIQGTTLDLQAGTAPTYNAGSPCYGPNDDSVKFNTGGYYECQDATTGNFGTNDFVIELLVYCSENNGTIISKKGGGAGWDFDVINNGFGIVFQIHDGATNVVVPYYSTRPGWIHVIAFGHRDDNNAAWGCRIYFNGMVGAFGSITGASGSVDNPEELCIGARAGGLGNPYTSYVAYAAMWQRANWFAIGVGNLEWDVIAKDRCAQIAGIYPSKVAGTATPNVMIRDTIGYVDKYEFGQVRRLYKTSKRWPRISHRRDKKTDQDLPEVISNSIPYSEDINNAAWTKIRATISTSTGEFFRKDEIQGIISNTDNDVHGISVGFTPASTFRHIFSCIAKQGEVPGLRLSSTNIFTYSVWAQFNLDDGTSGIQGTGDNAVLDSGIQPLGDGWYRCWIAYEGGTSDHPHLIVPVEDGDIDDTTYAGGGVNEDLFVTGIQHDYTEANVGSTTLREYIKTVGTVRTLGESLTGYLGELAATNVLLQSQAFATTWTKLDAGDAISTDATNAPDVTTTADGLVPSVTNGQHGFSQAATLTAATWTLSVWVSGDNSDWIQLQDTTASASAYFNVANGTVGTTVNCVARIHDWGNGWYRCIIVFTGTAVSHTIQIQAAEADNDNVFSGDAASNAAYFWGAQLETGAHASSYRPTTTSTATRNKDQVQFKGDDGNLGGVGSDQRGTVECSILLPDHDVPAKSTIFALSDGGAAADSIELSVQADDEIDLSSAATAGNSGNTTVAGDVADGIIHKLKAKWQVNNLVVAVNGTAGTPDTTIDPPDDLDQIDMGQSYDGSTQFSGVISNLKIFPK